MHLANGESRGAQSIVKNGSSGSVTVFVVRVVGRRQIKSASPFELCLTSPFEVCMTESRWPECAWLLLRRRRRVCEASRGEEGSDIVLDVGVELCRSDGLAATGVIQVVNRRRSRNLHGNPQVDGAAEASSLQRKRQCESVCAADQARVECRDERVLGVGQGDGQRQSSRPELRARCVGSARSWDPTLLLDGHGAIAADGRWVAFLGILESPLEVTH